MRSLICLCLVAATATLLWQALHIDGPAGTYPTIMTAGALLFALATLVQTVVRPAATPAVTVTIAPRHVVRVATFALLWTGYVFLLPTVGFIAGTFVALVVSLAILRGRPALVDLAGCGAFVLVLAVLLKTVLYVPVPQGIIDRNLDTLIYRLG